MLNPLRISASHLEIVDSSKLNLMQRVAEGNDAAVFKIVFNKKLFAAKCNKNLYRCLLFAAFPELSPAPLQRIDD